MTIKVHAAVVTKIASFQLASHDESQLPGGVQKLDNLYSKAWVLQ
jgi:hypothetical protein